MLRQIRIKNLLLIVIVLSLVTGCEFPDQNTSPAITQETTGQIGEPLIDSTYANEEVQIIRTDNCDGANPSIVISRSIENEKSTTFEILAEAGSVIEGSPIPTVLSAQVEAKIQAAAQLATSNTTQQSIEINLETTPGTILEHTIKWNIVKVKGIVDILFPGEKAQIGFDKVIGFDLLGRTSKSFECDLNSGSNDDNTMNETTSDTNPPTDTPEPLTIQPTETSVATSLPSYLSVGQVWEQDDVSLQLIDSSFYLDDPYLKCECVNFYFDITNNRNNDLLLTIKPGQFSAVDDTGNLLELVTVSNFQFCNPDRPLKTYKASLPPGESYWEGGQSAWNVSFCGNLTSASYIDVLVDGLAGITNAQWRLPIN